MKRILCLVLVLTTVCALITFMSVNATTYGNLSYENCGDHIEITDCSASAVSIDIPGKIDNLPVTIIGDGSFSFCDNLISVNIPNSVTRIGDRAFSGCGRVNIDVSPQNNVYSSIDGVLFNKAKTHILAYAKDIIQPDYTISDNVTSIGDSAFEYCESLTNIKIPDSVTSIGDSAFSGCESLKSINIPNSITSIGDSAFRSCGLTNVNIPDTVTSIGDSVFFNCRITSINLGNGLTSISNTMFSGCTVLENINIPNSVTSISCC